ncbi:DUF3667 domain-containing protein [Chryseobacterium profundimaris]|uniref:DUF3667 domain-containing protein n=1 Tax=Chryseobacterium profundimaris TaxID=1387275 RepID=A0ABY1NF63_9FLAO|nr:DUF3667 domain-containing protein [Chryseobacterium profundimaris]SMP07666.1 Protein of unknown function [Chryseobacterium profundimaris]
MNSHCLNCKSEVSYNYCPHCGQKTSTHRYSIKHFVEHDLVHGVWHVDKGILFTLKELFTRPGHSIREYIQEKRVNYFSFVTLILLLLTLTAMLAPYVHIKVSDLVSPQSRAMMNSMEEYMTAHPKQVLIISIPIYSLFSFLWFRRSGVNFSEHLVLNSYRVIPELIVGLVISALTIFYTNTAVVALLYFGVLSFFSFLYSILFYYQFFSDSPYSRKMLLFRSVMVPITYLLLPLVIGFLFGVFKETFT